MKRLYLWGCLLLAAALLIGCAPKLSDAFDEKAVLAAAEEIVTLMNGADYAGINGRTREDLRLALSEDVLASAAQQVLADAGAFVEFSKHTLAAQKDKATGEEYAVAMLQVKYENKTCIYTLAFDADMQLTGFYIK